MLQQSSFLEHSPRNIRCWFSRLVWDGKFYWHCFYFFSPSIPLLIVFLSFLMILLFSCHLHLILLSLWWDKSSVPRCLPLPFYFLLLIIWLHSIVVCLLYRKVQFLIFLHSILFNPTIYLYLFFIVSLLSTPHTVPLFPRFLCFLLSSFFRYSFLRSFFFSVSLRRFPYRWYYEWCSYTVQIVRSQHVGNWRSKRIVASNILPFQESREVSNNI